MSRLIAFLMMFIVGMAVSSTAAANGREAKIARTAHAQVCPKVVQYTPCSALQVEVRNFGATGWSGRSGPAAGWVQYNTYYRLGAAGWAQTVAHEVGGHHDAWREIVAKVGVSRAWTDYYDLDRYAEAFFEPRLGRDLPRWLAKEMYLDCVGPVRHGYTGNYLPGSGSTEVALCTGVDIVMTQAIAS